MVEKILVRKNITFWFNKKITFKTLTKNRKKNLRNWTIKKLFNLLEIKEKNYDSIYYYL